MRRRWLASGFTLVLVAGAALLANARRTRSIDGPAEPPAAPPAGRPPINTLSSAEAAATGRDLERPSPRAQPQAIGAEVGAPRTSEAATSPTDSSSLADIREAKKDASARGTAKLIAALESSDSLLVVEAADGLVARRATSAIRPLAKVDIRKSADIAPAVIDALGKLGAVAAPDERAAAVDRLIALLDQEKRRGARESLGNLLQIYEALGDTRHAKAATPLEAEIRDPLVARAAKNTAVQSLAKIASPTSRAPLLALRTELGAPDPAQRDAFEEQLRIELQQAVEVALRSIP